MESSKRGRAPNSGAGGHSVSCLVDECKSDLSKCRDYHRRHKVCEMHSKSPKVRIGGDEQRFCQQCSRFHSLGEFDEGKRSCRKRLEGHNRRRRKPQPQPQPVNHGNFLDGNNRYLGFSNQAMIPASSVSRSTSNWCAGVKAESNPSVVLNSSSSVLMGSYSESYRDSRINSENGLIINHHRHRQVMDIHSNHHDDDDHHRALSLLSSSTQTPEMDLGGIIQPNPNSPVRPSMSGLFYNHSIGQCLENGNSGSAALISNMRSNNSLCQDVDVFQTGSGTAAAAPPTASTATATATAAASAAHHTLSFSWE